MESHRQGRRVIPVARDRQRGITFIGLVILAMLDDAGVCVSTGSACNADSQDVSAVLRAMKLPFPIARGSIRFSLGRYNTGQEVDQTLAILSEIIPRIGGTDFSL